MDGDSEYTRIAFHNSKGKESYYHRQDRHPEHDGTEWV